MDWNTHPSKSLISPKLIYVFNKIPYQNYFTFDRYIDDFLKMQSQAKETGITDAI